MAEINIQRKKSSGWIWILAIAAFAVALVVLGGTWGADEADTVATAPETSSRDVAATTGAGESLAAPVEAFLTFADNPPDPSVGRAHEYASEGIRRLSAALNAVIDQRKLDGSSVEKQLSAFQAKADRIQADPQAAGHAAQVHDVFTSAAALMSALQQEEWPQASDLRDQIAEVRSAANAVDPQRPLLDQTEAVAGFFERAASVVRSISERT